MKIIEALARRRRPRTAAMTALALLPGTLLYATRPAPDPAAVAAR